MCAAVITDGTLARIKLHDNSLVSPVTDGKRQISLGLLSPPSSASSRSVSSTSSANTATTQTRFITIPTHLDSSATFEFIGFTTERAVKLFQGRAQRVAQTGTEISLLQWAVEWVEGVCTDIADSSDDWEATMKEAGIKDDVQTALMKEEYANIRLIQSLETWLSEIVETGYEALLDMNARIVEELDSPTLHLRGGDEEPYTVPQTPGGHIALFKSVEYRRCQGCLEENGTLNLGRLESTGPTDFCRRGGLYFTHQLWVASHYSALITDPCQVADRRAVEVHVPLSHFQSVGLWNLKFEYDDFKILLFHSRRDEMYPKDLVKKRAQYGVVTGPIAHAHNFSFGKMNNWQDITSKHQLHSKGGTDSEGPELETEIGKQHVWIRDEAVSQLEDDVTGKVYIRKPEQGFKLVPQPWNDESVKTKG